MIKTLMILQYLLLLSFSYADYIQKELGEDQKMNVIMKEQTQKALVNSWPYSSFDDNSGTKSARLKVCTLISFFVE